MMLFKWEVRGQELYILTQPDAYEDFTKSNNISIQQMVKVYPFQQRCLMASVNLNVYSVDMFTYSTDRNDYFIVLPITWLHVRSCIVMYFVYLSNLFPFSWPYKHEFVMFSPTFPQTPFKDFFLHKVTANGGTWFR